MQPEVETINHLFLHCQATKAVLFASLMCLRIEDDQRITIQNYIVNWIFVRGGYVKLRMGACLLWAIWKSRNNIVFDRRRFNIEAILKEAAYWFNMETSNVEDSTIPTEDDFLDAQSDQWNPPPTQIKIIFDGTAGPKGFECGWIARDSLSSFCGCQTISLTYSYAAEAEAHDVQIALDLAEQKDYKDIILEGDSLIVINSLRYNNYQQPLENQSSAPCY